MTREPKRRNDIMGRVAVAFVLISFAAMVCAVVDLAMMKNQVPSLPQLRVRPDDDAILLYRVLTAILCPLSLQIGVLLGWFSRHTRAGKTAVALAVASFLCLAVVLVIQFIPVRGVQRFEVPYGYENDR